MVTAADVSQVEEPALLAGVACLLRKPVFVQDIWVVLDRYLRQQTAPGDE